MSEDEFVADDTRVWVDPQWLARIRSYRSREDPEFVMPYDEDQQVADTEAVRHLARQAAVGARLFYALYHHPGGVDFHIEAMKSLGLQNAYMAATEVFIPRGEQWPEGDVHFNPRPDEDA